MPSVLYAAGSFFFVSSASLYQQKNMCLYEHGTGTIIFCSVTLLFIFFSLLSFFFLRRRGSAGNSRGGRKRAQMMKLGIKQDGTPVTSSLG